MMILFDSDYYPAGAFNDPAASYNWPEPVSNDVECNVYSTLTKKDVKLEANEDQDGEYEELFCEQRYTIGELLDDYLNILNERLGELKKLKPTPEVSREIKTLNRKIEDASGWEEEEIEVEI